MVACRGQGVLTAALALGHRRKDNLPVSYLEVTQSSATTLGSILIFLLPGPSSLGQFPRLCVCCASVPSPCSEPAWGRGSTSPFIPGDQSSQYS